MWKKAFPGGLIISAYVHKLWYCFVFFISESNLFIPIRIILIEFIVFIQIIWCV